MSFFTRLRCTHRTLKETGIAVEALWLGGKKKRTGEAGQASAGNAARNRLVDL